MAIIGVALGILSLSSFILIVNKSQLDRCNLFAFTGAVFFTGFLLSIMSAIFNKGIHTVPPILAALAVVAGVASVSSFLFQLAAINSGGRLSVINIIGNLSTLIPIIYSITVFHEKVGITKYIGIALFIVFIFLLNYRGKEESV